MEWLTREQLLAIHKIATRLTVSVVDEHKLGSALDRPMTNAFGRELFPTLWDKAACLMHSIATTHPFTEDGNKRTAWVAVLTVLELNGWLLEASEDESEALVLDVVAHRIDIPEVSQWLEKHCVRTGSIPPNWADEHLSIVVSLDERRQLILTISGNGAAISVPIKPDDLRDVAARIIAVTDKAVAAGFADDEPVIKTEWVVGQLLGKIVPNIP